MDSDARPSAAETAEALARWMHRDQTDKSGRPYVEHLERVAAAVSDEAKAAAWLHDIIEDTPLKFHDLIPLEISETTLWALNFLTHYPMSFDGPVTYARYIRQIAAAPGEWGEISREVKIADLRDNLSDERRYPGDESIRDRYVKALAMLGATL